MSENNSLSFSNEPITQDAALEQILGMVNPKGQIDDESTEEVVEIEATDSNETEEEVEVEATDAEEETEEEVETEAATETNDLELDEAEFDQLTGIREIMTEGGFENVEAFKSGLLRQQDYTRKTQALAEEKKSFETQRSTALEETAKTLEVAQAMIYGNAPKVSSEELAKLKESDPHAYSEFIEQKVEYDARKAEIDQVIQKVGEQHQAQLQEKQAAYVQQQTELVKQLIPDFADESKAKEIVSNMSEYVKSIGQDPAMLDTVTDALALKVLYDASHKSLPATKKRGPKRVIRKATSTSKAEKQATAKKQRLRQSTQPDGSFSRDSAVDLILESFK